MSDSFIDFEGRYIILSGASSGIGRVVAQFLSGFNAHLVLLGRDREQLQETENSLSGEGHRAIQIDLSDTDNIRGVLQPLLADLGDVYGLCHCAGTIQLRPLSSTRRSVLDQQMEINLTAGIELAKLVSGPRAESEGGSIVFISSICADVGAVGQTAYCASKGAVNAAARAMALELAPRGVRVNTVSPGLIRTDMTEKKSRLNEEQIKAIVDKYPLGEGSPADVARACAFLLDPKSRWITGIDLKVDGGYTAQ